MRQQRTHPLMRLIFERLGLVALSVAVFLAGVEVYHRVRAPYRAFGGAYELTQFRHGGREAAGAFVLDPAFGFRPVLGQGRYGESGTLLNSYSKEKRPGVQRLLFVGDSVTSRGRIVEALRARYGDDRYEYWNAGVESFNTVQEVQYYKRFNRQLHPDEIVLTFHLNDFETTPVAFTEADGTLVVYAPNWPIRRLNPWLFRHSYAYRYWLGLVTPQKSDRSEIEVEVEAALAELNALASADGARLTVLVLPILRPVEQWRPEYVEYHRRVLAMLRAGGIRHFDLLQPLGPLLAARAPVAETGDDLFWHPNDAAAAAFADYLVEQCVFEPCARAPGQ